MTETTSMRTIETTDQLVKGQSVYIIERGKTVGPFTVHATTGGRTEDHAILSGRSGLFEHYAPFNTYRIETITQGETEMTETMPNVRIGKSDIVHAIGVDGLMLHKNVARPGTDRHPTADEVTCKQCLKVIAQTEAIAFAEKMGRQHKRASELLGVDAPNAVEARLVEFHGAEAMAYVTEHYPAALPLLAEGWTLESAMDHVQGTCDRAHCTGEHAEIVAAPETRIRPANAAGVVMVGEIRNNPEIHRLAAGSSGTDCAPGRTRQIVNGRAVMWADIANDAARCIHCAWPSA